MSHLVLELGNSNNWSPFFYTKIDAVTSNNGELFTPIPTITVPILFDSHIIAVSVSCSKSKPTWYFGGFLNQRISLGLTVGGLPDSDAVQKRRLYLDRLTLIIFPKIVSTYAVTIDVPKWFEDVSINIFEYIGPESDSTEDLIAQLQNQLNAIAQKVNIL